MEGGYGQHGQAMTMRQGQGMQGGMAQGMTQGMQAGYGVGANGQGMGVNHMGGVQAVAGVNGQVPQQMAPQQGIMGQGMGQGMGHSMGQGMGAQGMGQGMVAGGVGHGNVQGGMMGGGSMSTMGMGDFSLEDVLGPFPCVRLRGLPFEATIDDVLRFFQGLVPLDVVMVTRGDGRGAGEAIVVLPNQYEMQMALSRDKQHMGRRYIEIFQSKRMDYYSAIVGQLQAQNMGGGLQRQGGMGHAMGGGGGIGTDGLSMPAVHTGIIRMRGLPFSATKQDVINFFQGMPVTEDTIQFVVRGDGRVTGEAFVSFGSPAESEAAMSRNGNHMGTRYVELFASTQEEIVRHMNRT